MPENQFRLGLTRYFTPEQLDRLSKACIGIAGAGGLGSNAAMYLARSGIENFILADHDIIESSNLNRQHYWPGQIGLRKVEALSTHLLELNPAIKIRTFQDTLTPDNLPRLLALAPVWIEALDKAEAKKMFVENALGYGCRVASASGVAGYGGEPLKKRKIGNLILVGDFVTGIDVAPPLAPRVAQAAAIMADSVLEFVLSQKAPNP